MMCLSGFELYSPWVPLKMEVKWKTPTHEYDLIYLWLFTLLWNQARLLVYIVSIRIIVYSMCNQMVTSETRE